MSETVSAVEARQRFGEMLNRVALRGEEIVIERAGRKIARLVPVEEKTKRPQSRLDFCKAAGLGKEVWSGADYILTSDQAWKKFEEVRVVLVGDLSPPPVP